MSLFRMMLPSPGRPTIWRARGVHLIVLSAALIGAVLGGQALLLHLSVDPLGDVHAYYDAATRLNHGLPLYIQPADTDSAAFYRYPPLLAIIFRPLALLPFPAAALAWEGFLAVAFGATIVRLGVREPVLITLAFLGVATAWSLAIGQAQVLVTALLALGTPFGVALAGNLKVFPILVALWWLLRGDWHAVARCVAWTGTLVAIRDLPRPLGRFGGPALDRRGPAREDAIRLGSGRCAQRVRHSTPLQLPAFDLDRRSSPTRRRDVRCGNDATVDPGAGRRRSGPRARCSRSCFLSNACPGGSWSRTAARSLRSAHRWSSTGGSAPPGHPIEESAPAGPFRTVGERPRLRVGVLMRRITESAHRGLAFSGTILVSGDLRPRPVNTSTSIRPSMLRSAFMTRSPHGPIQPRLHLAPAVH